jgi:hypothetical protein
MDAPLWKVPINFIFRRGCYPGDSLRVWIAGLLRSKISSQGEITMSQLNGAVIYAAQHGLGTITFDSSGARKETVAAFAARCSMSIPIFFVPQQIDGRRVYDGGLRNNFPASQFLKDHPGKPFIGLYLSAGGGHKKSWVGTELMDIWIDGEERQFVDAHASSVVVIDTSPVGTVDFGLGALEKEFLLKVGKASALRFLQSRKLDGGPEDAAVESASKEAEDCRNAVRRMRKWRKIRRACTMLVLVVVAYFVLPMAWRVLLVAWSALWRIV